MGLLIGSFTHAGDYSSAPNDDFFPSSVSSVAGQWYMENRDPATGASLGADINARSAWTITHGQGVTVAVVDTGIELAHSELKHATTNGLHFNFFKTNSISVGPIAATVTGAHGTSCAGLIAAEANNQIGMSGIAPAAQLASWVIFDSKLNLAPPASLAAMYQYASNTVWVQNHSWGATSTTQQAPTAVERAGIDNAWRAGRFGLGTIMIRAGGNHRDKAGNANDDGWANDPDAICVAAVRPEGRAASYSNAGACILVAAPGGDSDTGGLFTTDLTGFSGANPFGFFPPFEYLSDFRFNSLGFSGTSAAAPVVSGVAALILSANPNLTARDVQQILIFSAHHFDSADGGLSTNAAGLRLSHNVGFGIPDAGEAVRLARLWSNRPPAIQVTVATTNRLAIPDDGLRVEVWGENIPAELSSIHCLPGTGIQPDLATARTRLIDVGLATNHIDRSLSGQAALIIRGTNGYADKLNWAAQAGASFAVVYNYSSGPSDNCPGGDQLCPLGGTDFSPIPGVFITYANGIALQSLFATNPTARVRLAATSATASFAMTNQLSCEQVTLRLRTDHPLRGDLRVVLTSPQGTRSVLQTYNSDTAAGPVDWAYMTTHSFFEEAAGTWLLSVTDESSGAVGSILGAELTIRGVPIVDTDKDGLDDRWEIAHFGDLRATASETLDGDSWSNVREFIQGTDPRTNDQPFLAMIAPWNDENIRVSWPNDAGGKASIDYGSAVDTLTQSAQTDSRGAEGVWIGPSTNRTEFFRVSRSAGL